MIAAGELILSGLPAGRPDRDTRHLLSAAGFAGYLLLRRNAGTPDELAELVESLDDGDGLPRIITIDEEGGLVSRLDHLGLRAPSAMAVAATGDPQAAVSVARSSGDVLRTLGFNVVLGPCLDILSEPRNPVIATRAYGEDAPTVTAFGLAALAGFRASGLGTVVKHFPGHGGTLLDSHVASPAVDVSGDAMWRRELEPFRRAVGEGVDAMMTAHVRYPQATPEDEGALPATLSRHWMTGVLRNELGFDGVVLSDALEMQGVAGGRRLTDVVSAGVRAGIDLFVCEDLEDAMRVRGQLLALADAGGAPAAAIGRSVERVRRWRATLERGARGTSPTRALLDASNGLDEVQRRATALVADSGGVLPLDPASHLLFVLPRELDANRPVDVEFLRDAMVERFPAGRVIALEPEPTEGEVRLLAELARADAGLTVILGVMGHRPDRWVAAAIRALATGTGPRVGVALSRPLDVLALPESWTCLLTYGFGRPALEALLDTLSGRLPARGEILGLGGRPAP